MNLPEKKNRELRFITGFVIGAIILSAMMCGGWVLLCAVVLFTFLCAREYVQILRHKGFQPSEGTIMVMLLLMITAAVTASYSAFPVLMFAGVTLAFASVLFRRRQPYIANVATTVFGYMLCYLPCYVFMLRSIGSSDNMKLCSDTPGCGYIVMMFFVILATDLGAYFFGTRFGKKKLIEDVSPKKTVFGAVAGTICAVLTAIIVGKLINLSFITSLIAGTIFTIFAQTGDLCESLIKRDAGVKDSGDTLPGHGGFLDRADSYLLTAPVAYYFFEYFVCTPIVIDIQRIFTGG